MAQTPASDTRSVRRLPRILLAGVVPLVLAVMGWSLWRHWHRAPNDDARLTFATPYRNVRPGVGYVGDAVCERCHAAATESYHHHPMSRSMAPVSERHGAEEKILGSFAARGFQYQVERRGDRVVHRETINGVLSSEHAVAFEIGSGARGLAYLVDRDGYLFQSPISWYSQSKSWDLSPGYQHVNRHFDRPIIPECLFCHTNQTEPVAGMINRFAAPVFRGHAIGCERCHGPGALHVERYEKNPQFSGFDDTIVNPQDLSPALRDAVCQQCHQHGETRILRRGRQWNDFRPGLPFDLISAVYLRRDQVQDQKAVGQFEQMASSRCFQATSGPNQLTCSTCHSPHDYPAPEAKPAYYRGRCLECHNKHGCRLPMAQRQAKADNCIACHMPRRSTTDIAHTALTDHRILRDPAHEKSAKAHTSNSTDPPLVQFFLHAQNSDPEAERDLGVAIMDWSNSQPPDRRLAKEALPLLQSAVARHPNDLAAWEAQGYAQVRLGREREAQQSFGRVLQSQPNAEQSLYGATMAADRDGQAAQALDYCTKLLAVNPNRPGYHTIYGHLQMNAGHWSEAVAACRKALALNPFEWTARRMVVDALRQEGQRQEADKEMDLMRRCQAAMTGQ